MRNHARSDVGGLGGEIAVAVAYSHRCGSKMDIGRNKIVEFEIVAPPCSASQISMVAEIYLIVELTIFGREESSGDRQGWLPTEGDRKLAYAPLPSQPTGHSHCQSSFGCHRIVAVAGRIESSEIKV